MSISNNGARSLHGPSNCTASLGVAAGYNLFDDITDHCGRGLLAPAGAASGAAATASAGGWVTKVASLAYVASLCPLACTTPAAAAGAAGAAKAMVGAVITTAGAVATGVSRGVTHTACPDERSDVSVAGGGGVKLRTGGVRAIRGAGAVLAGGVRARLGGTIRVVTAMPLQLDASRRVLAVGRSDRCAPTTKAGGTIPEAVDRCVATWMLVPPGGGATGTGEPPCTSCSMRTARAGPGDVDGTGRPRVTTFRVTLAPGGPRRTPPCTTTGAEAKGNMAATLTGGPAGAATRRAGTSGPGGLEESRAGMTQVERTGGQLRAASPAGCGCCAGASWVNGRGIGENMRHGITRRGVVETVGATPQ